MLITTFWKIILKGIGLWMLIKAFEMLPRIIFAATSSQDFESELLEYIGVIAAYLFINALFLFKDNTIIRVLKLDKGFAETHLNISYPHQSVLKIAIIIIAGVTIVQSLASLCFEMYNFWMQKHFFEEYRRAPYLIFYIVESVLAYLALTNAGTIVKWIRKDEKDNPS